MRRPTTRKMPELDRWSSLSDSFMTGGHQSAYAEPMTLTLNFIGIATSDLAASLRFYRTLGLDIPQGAESEPHVEVRLPGGTTIAWDPVSTLASFIPGYRLPTGPGRITFACGGARPRDVDEAYAALVAAYPDAGVTEPWDAPWGQRYATVHDPDGNAIDLYAPLGDDAGAAVESGTSA